MALEAAVEVKVVAEEEVAAAAAEELVMEVEVAEGVNFY